MVKVCQSCKTRDQSQFYEKETATCKKCRLKRTKVLRNTPEGIAKGRANKLKYGRGTSDRTSLAALAKARAGMYVRRAVKNGIIFRKNICAACFTENIETNFHHLNGYAKANYLDVVELCSVCHAEAHTEPDHQFHPRMGDDLSISMSPV